MRTADPSLSLRDFLSDVGLDKWLRALGVPDAPLRRAGLRTALGFLAVELPSMQALDALDLIAAMPIDALSRSRHALPLTRLRRTPRPRSIPGRRTRITVRSRSRFAPTTLG